MSVTKTTGAEVYSVKNAGEWATIVIRSWDELGLDGKPHHRGELLVNSTFGTWSNYWSALGVSFKKFLIGLEFDYLMTRLMGRELEEHDGIATFKDLRSRVLSMRRKGRIDKGAAAWLWREMNDRHESLEGSVESFCRACGEIESEAERVWSRPHTAGFDQEVSELFEEPWLRTKTRVNRAAAGFWRDIWPEFVRALEEEGAAEPEVEDQAERPRG